MHNTLILKVMKKLHYYYDTTIYLIVDILE